jgi:hypothetical protein
MIDIGSGSVKLMLSGRCALRRFQTGTHLTAPAQEMTARVRLLVHDWRFDAVSIVFRAL